MTAAIAAGIREWNTGSWMITRRDLEAELIVMSFNTDLLKNIRCYNYVYCVYMWLNNCIELTALGVYLRMFVCNTNNGQ